jgi:hypothetical protein
MGLSGEGGRAPEKLDGFPNTACRLGTPGDLEGPSRQAFAMPSMESLCRKKQRNRGDDEGCRGEEPCLRGATVDNGTQPKGIKRASKAGSQVVNPTWDKTPVAPDWLTRR